MPASKPETHPCPDHPNETYTVRWVWKRGETIESSEPDIVDGCSACYEKRLSEEADEFEESGQTWAASVLRRELAARKARRKGGK